MGGGLIPEYDLWVVALSVTVAVFASFIALGLAARIPRVEARLAGRWLVGGAFAMGGGIWAMHFLGMLAFHLPIPLAYDIPLTILSIVLAIAASGLALYLIRLGLRSRGQLHGSALLLASGICAMHYTGMAALRMSPPIDYRPGLVLASFAIAYAASWFALRFAFRANAAAPLFTLGHLVGALFLGGAIAGMHYTGMAAARFSPGSVCLASPMGLGNPQVALVVTAITLLILLATLLLLAYDLRLTEQRARLLAELERRNRELESQARELAQGMTAQIREGARRDHMLAAVVAQSGDAILTLDMDRHITSWNKAAESLFGYRSEEAAGQVFAALLKPGGPEGSPGSGMPQVGAGRLMRLHHRNGRALIASFTTSPLQDESGGQAGEILILRDVTEERHVHDQLQLMGLVIENMGEAILITDGDKRIVSVNKAFSSITGYTAEEVLGRNPSLLASGKHDKAFYQSLWRDLQRQGTWKGEIWNRRKDGSLYPEWLSITILRDAQGRACNYIGIFTDITAFKEKEARIEYLAQHDHLTRLPNRLLLRDRLQQAIAQAGREGSKLAVLFIDLDRFKYVNDSLGHAVGDRLLQEVATRLTALVRAEDTVSRQGGDEFVILLNGIRNIAHIAHLAERFLENLSLDYAIDRHRLHITPSIGISLYPDDGDSIEALIRNADTAMYHAKETGRATYQFYTETLNAALAERMALEGAIQSALARGEFHLHLQPQYRIRDGRLLGAEALLRWQHPEKGAIPPDRFIPLAEEANLIEPIGLWVLEEVIGLLHGWRDGPLAGAHLSVNVSPNQLANPDFAAQVQALLQRHPIDPARLQLEVTETSLMQDVERSRVQLQELKRLGLRIAVDDFGTGHSSLNYLKRLPIDELKIDRSFIRDIPEDPHDVILSRAIINLAHTLQYQVVAEGVETPAQLAFLLEAGCDLAQGYHLARPMPVPDFVALAERNRGIALEESP